MTELVPDPASLGVESPTIGPWFSTDVTLPVPDSDLGVPVTIPDGTDWLPPAAGLLSYAVVSTPLPAILAGLRGPSGAPPFSTGRLVIVHRLLPEVEERLGALLADIPPADGAATVPGLVTRQSVRTFALQLPEDGSPLAQLSLGDPQIADLPGADQAKSVGLSESGGILGNGREPMTDLKRPGQFPGRPSEALFHFAHATDVRLFAFDQRGRAIDPGAVAAWWKRMATTFTNLFAASSDTPTGRTANVESQLSVHIVGPDDAPASDDVLGRLETTNATGTGAVRVRGATAAAASFVFTGGSADAAPRAADRRAARRHLRSIRQPLGSRPCRQCCPRFRACGTRRCRATPRRPAESCRNGCKRSRAATSR